MAGTDNLSSFSYSYGAGGAPGGFRDNRVSQSKQYGSETVQNVSYGYNTTSMLTGESGAAGGTSAPAFNFSYSFDAMGNRTLATNLSAQTRTDSTYNGLNQLTESSSYSTAGTQTLTGTQSYGYDGDGNMSQAVSKDAGGAVTGTASYVYDDASRLTSITTATSKTEFFYDGLSRLRTSTYSTGSVGNWVVQNEKRRVYKGMDVVQERDGSNAVTASLTRTENIGGILARSTSAGHSYFGYDGGGNVTTLTSTAGAVVGSYTYDAWGNLLASSGTRANENPYRFSTKENVAGLYYYGYRFYAPGLGRWINRDPIREMGGANIYGFLSNTPTNLVDLNGCVGLDIQAAIAGFLVAGVGSFIMQMGMAAYQSWRYNIPFGCWDIKQMLLNALLAGLMGAIQGWLLSEGIADSRLAAGILGGVVGGAQSIVSQWMSGGGISGSQVAKDVSAGFAGGLIGGGVSNNFSNLPESGNVGNMMAGRIVGQIMTKVGVVGAAVGSTSGSPPMKPCCGGFSGSSCGG